MTAVLSQVVDDLIEQDFEQVDFGGSAYQELKDLRKDLSYLALEALISMSRDPSFTNFKARYIKQLDDAGLLSPDSTLDSLELSDRGKEAAMFFRAGEIVHATWSTIANDVAASLRPDGSPLTLQAAVEATLDHLDAFGDDREAIVWIVGLDADTRYALVLDELRGYGYPEESIEEQDFSQVDFGLYTLTPEGIEEQIWAIVEELEEASNLHTYKSFERTLETGGFQVGEHVWVARPDDARAGASIVSDSVDANPRDTYYFDATDPKRAAAAVHEWASDQLLQHPEELEELFIEMYRDLHVIDAGGHSDEVDKVYVTRAIWKPPAEVEEQSFDQIDFGQPGDTQVRASHARQRGELIRWMQDHETLYYTWPELARAALDEVFPEWEYGPEIPDWVADAATALYADQEDEEDEPTDTTNELGWQRHPDEDVPEEESIKEVSYDQVDFGDPAPEPEIDLDSRVVWIHSDELERLFRGLPEDEVGTFSWVAGAMDEVAELVYSDEEALGAGLIALHNLGIPFTMAVSGIRPAVSDQPPLPRPDEEEVRSWMQANWEEYDTVFQLANDAAEHFYIWATADDDDWLYGLARETPLPLTRQEGLKEQAHDQIDFGLELPNAPFSQPVLRFIKQRDEESWSQPDIVKHINDEWGMSDYLHDCVELARQELIVFGEEDGNWHLTPYGDEVLTTLLGEQDLDNVDYGPGHPPYTFTLDMFIPLTPDDLEANEALKADLLRIAQEFEGSLGMDLIELPDADAQSISYDFHTLVDAAYALEKMRERCPGISQPEIDSLYAQGYHEPPPEFEERVDLGQIDFGDPLRTLNVQSRLTDLTPFQNSVLSWMIDRFIDQNYDDWNELANEAANEWDLHPAPDWLALLARVVLGQVEEGVEEQVSPLSPDYQGALSPDASGGALAVDPNRGNVLSLATVTPDVGPVGVKNHGNCDFYSADPNRIGWGQCSNFDIEVDSKGAPCGEYQAATLSIESIAEQSEINFDQIDWGEPKVPEPRRSAELPGPATRGEYLARAEQIVRVVATVAQYRDSQSRYAEPGEFTTGDIIRVAGEQGLTGQTHMPFAPGPGRGTGAWDVFDWSDRVLRWLKVLERNGVLMSRKVNRHHIFKFIEPPPDVARTEEPENG